MVTTARITAALTSLVAPLSKGCRINVPLKCSFSLGDPGPHIKHASFGLVHASLHPNNISISSLNFLDRAYACRQQT